MTKLIEGSLRGLRHEPTLRVAHQPWNQINLFKASCLRLGVSQHWIQLQDVSRVKPTLILFNTSDGGNWDYLTKGMSLKKN